MAKRIYAVLLCVAMVFSLLPTFAVAEGEGVHTHDTQTYTAHDSGTSLPTGSGFYYLTTDVELPATFNTYGQSYSGKTTTICLNGHTISRTGTGRIFNVTGTSNLTICDCSQTPGTITGGNMSGNGGMANVASGGVLKVSDVTISGNTGTAAGAISTQGKVTLENVYMTNNTNTSAGGSAIYAAGGSQVTIRDCTITGNNSQPASGSYNGAVYVTNGTASLSVEGSTVISGNTVCDGTVPCDLLLQDASARLTVGLLAEGAAIGVTTEVKKFGTAAQASDFLVLGADAQALAAVWRDSWITYANTDQAVVYSADGFTFAAVSGADEEGHANTEGYDKAGHGTVAWQGVSSLDELNGAPSGHYYLKNDITMTTARLTVSNDVTICLNGYTLDRDAAAGGYARVIHINAGAKLTICDCTAHTQEDGTYSAGHITGGWAVQGSGAYVLGQLDLYDGIFTGNRTEDYNGTVGQGVIAVLSGGVFNMHGGEISGNTSTGDGAGVFLFKHAGNTFHMTGGTIQNNIAQGDGGGLVVSGLATASITGGAIVGNQAAKGAGILLQGADNSLTLTDATVTGNRASQLGGGMYLGNSNAVIGGSTVITGNTAGGQSANVYMLQGVSFRVRSLTGDASIGFLMAQEPGTVAASGVRQATLGCFVNDNASSGYTLLLNGSRLVLGTPREGLAHPVEGYGKCGHGDSNVTWQNWGDEDAEQGVLPTLSGHYYLSGDVVLSDTAVIGGDADIVLCLNGYSITGSGSCGLLRVDTGAAVRVCDCTQSGQLTGGNGARGAAVLVNGGAFYLEDGSITDNTITGNATNTGAVHVASGTFTLAGGYIVANPIHGVFVGGGVFNMTGGEISENTASTNGGGVRLGGGEFNMTGGVITGNSTTGSSGGSALAVQAGTANITGGEIYGNTSGSGGTIYSAGDLHISDVTIHDNTTPSNGGALYIGGGTAALTDVVLENNDASQSMGGGLMVAGGTVTVNGGAITGNTAIYGGGIRVNGGTVVLNDVAITENTASGNGGGISVKGGHVSINGGTVTGNTAAAKGGAIFFDAAQDAGSLTLVDVSITGNTAGVEGGGVYSVNATAELILGGKTVITQNTVNGQQENLALGHRHNVTLDSQRYPLETGACVGVTVYLAEEGRLVAVGADQENAASCFVSDQAQTIELRGTELWLVISAAAAHEDHVSDECGHEDASWSMLLDSADITKGNNHLYLISDLVLTDPVMITDVEVTICLNGFDIIKSDSQVPDFNRLFRVSGGSLTICDCKGTGHLRGGTAAQGSAIFINGAGAQVNLYGGSISGNTSADSATDPNTASLGTVCVINGTFNMYGGAICDNTAVNGSAVTVYKEGAVFNLYDGTIENNVSTGTGDTHSGAINMRGGQVNLLGGQICGNKGNYGGAIRTGGGKLTIDKTVITGNTAYTDGGAVYALRTQIVMTGGVISGNTAGDTAGGMSIGSGCDAKLTGGEISDNTAKGRYAGGLKLQGTEPVVLLDGVSITGNASAENGGGVYVGSGTLTLASGTISGNTAKYGGGVRMGGGEFRITGGSIENNTATSDGGGIYAIRSQLTMTGGTVRGNKASGSAGGMNLGSGCKAALSGGSVSANYASKYGGGIVTSGDEPVAELSGVRITGNTCAQQGGGVYVHKGTVNMTGGEISGNTAQYGGGIRGAEGTVNITGGTVSRNKAQDGGGIYTIRTELNITGISITDNEASTSGGGLALGSGTKAALTDVTIEGNTSANYGGGLLMQGTEPALTMTGCVVKDNTTGGFGGGIAAYRGTFSAEDITITGNTANYGGGFYTGRATNAVLKNYTMENNTAVTDGGGAYLLRSPITLDTGVIRGNTAGANGGGISCGSETLVYIIGPTTISNNTATSGGGLMVQGTNPQVQVGDGTDQVLITDNQVTGSGGGIRAGAAGSGSLNMTKVTVSGNRSDSSEAGAAGSGIYYGSRMTSLYQDCVITDNHGAGLGGGMHVGYASDVTLRQCQLTNNSSIGNGGGLYLLVRSIVTLDNSVVSGNSTSVRGGGAVIQSSAQLIMRDSAMDENTGGMGGGLYIEAAGKLDATGSTINGNTATRQASAIYAQGSVYLTDTTVSGNTDQAGGCAVYLDGTGGDGESYLPGVNQFRGKVVLSENEGGELVFAGNACVNIYGDGLSEGSRILVDNPNGGITRLLIGPYDYVREGDRYTLTPGQKSLSQSDPVTEAQEPTDPPETTQPGAQTQPDKENNTLLTVIVGVLALAVGLSVLAVILGLKRRKHNGK